MRLTICIDNDNNIGIFDINDESKNIMFCGNVIVVMNMVGGDGDAKYKACLIWHISKGMPGATLKPVSGKTPGKEKWFESIFLFFFFFF